MKRTFQALAITSIVVPVAEFLSIILYFHAYFGGWFAFHPAASRIAYLDKSQLDAALLLVWQGLNETLWTSIVAIFAVVVAAQARRWGWMSGLILLGLFAISAPMLIWALPLQGLGLLGNPLIDAQASYPFGPHISAPILYALVLVFALLQLRRQDGAASASVSPAPQV